MTVVETIIWVIVIAVTAFLVAFLAITLPNCVKSIPRKRYQYTEPADASFKNDVHANGVEEGSSVDKAKALNSFKT